MKIVGIHHASFLVSDLEQARRFYREILELVELERPELGYPGLWLQLGQGQQLHLMQLPDPDAGRQAPEHGGRDRHLALQVEGLEGLRQRLERRQWPYTLSRSGRKALFCRDPDGNALELVEVTAPA